MVQATQWRNACLDLAHDRARQESIRRGAPWYTLLDIGVHGLDEYKPPHWKSPRDATEKVAFGHDVDEDAFTDEEDT